MPAKAKVGSWLDKSNGSGVDEAYESSDDEGSSARVAAAAAVKTNQPLDDGDSDDEVDEGGDLGRNEETKREVNVDWENVLPKIRPALEDPSSKRRRAFIDKYLYVNESCESARYGSLRFELTM